MALKMEYLGNFLFYFFFIKFILSYMQIDVRHKWVRILTYLWMLFEVAVIAVVWDDTTLKIISKTAIEEKTGTNSKLNWNTTSIISGIRITNLATIKCDKLCFSSPPCFLI